MSKKRERTPETVGIGPDPLSAESLLFQLASDTSTDNPHQPKIPKTGKSVHGDNGSNNSSDSIDESIDVKADASSVPGSIANKKHPAAVVPSSTLRQCDGLDVVRKGSRGRGRQLMVLPGVLGMGKSTTGCKLGVLKDVTSAFPILYVEFPEGRLKCTGRTVHTKGRFFTLYADKAANKATRMDCRDVFDSVVFFSKACWVGKAEDNPSEEALPLPESLQSLSEESTESAGKSDFRTHFGGGKPYSPQKTTGDSSTRGEGENNEPGTEVVPAAAEGVTEKQARRSSRSTKSTVTYVEDSDDFEGDDGENDGEDSSSSDVESVSVVKEEAKEDKPGDADVPEVFSILDAPTAERKPATVGSGREGDSKKATPKTPSKKNQHSSVGRSKGKKRRALSSSESEDGDSDGEGEIEGDRDSESPASEEEKGSDGVAFTPEPSRRSRRASALSRVKYTQSSGSEEEEDNEEEENDDDDEEFDV